MPGFAGAETLEEKDNNELRERDYTQIDTPSRGPSTPRGPPKPTRPSNYYGGGNGNRYEINGAGINVANPGNAGNRIPYQDNRPKQNSQTNADQDLPGSKDQGKGTDFFSFLSLKISG